MSTLQQFTPIILLGVIILAVVLIVIKGSRKYNRTKQIYWVLGVYLILLFLSLGLYLFIPVSQPGEMVEVEDVPSLYDIAYDGASIDTASNYKVKHWELKSANDQITIRYRGDDENAIPVRVDRKENDGKIEATYYQTPTYVAGIDVTPHINPVRVNMESDMLFVDLPESVSLEFTSFKKEFPMKQLTDEGFWENDDWEEDAGETLGEQLLYLRIPENMKVNADEDLDISYEGVGE